MNPRRMACGRINKTVRNQAGKRQQGFSLGRPFECSDAVDLLIEQIFTRLQRNQNPANTIGMTSSRQNEKDNKESGSEDSDSNEKRQSQAIQTGFGGRSLRVGGSIFELQNNFTSELQKNAQDFGQMLLQGQTEVIQKLGRLEESIDQIKAHQTSLAQSLDLLLRREQMQMPQVPYDQVPHLKEQSLSPKAAPSKFAPKQDNFNTSIGANLLQLMKSNPSHKPQNPSAPSSNFNFKVTNLQEIDKIIEEDESLNPKAEQIK